MLGLQARLPGTDVASLHLQREIDKAGGIVAGVCEGYQKGGADVLQEAADPGLWGQGTCYLI